MKRRRSIVFYLWLGLSVQFLLLVLVIVFVLAGASYQTSAIRALHEQVQGMQLVNLTVQNEYLDAQRALRGYQATGEDRFLQTFYGDQDGFGLDLRQLRDDAWPAMLAGVTSQARTAQTAFGLADQRNTRRLRALIEDMLTISKMELGSFTSNLRPLDLAELVPQVADAVLPSAAEGGLTLEAQLTAFERYLDPVMGAAAAMRAIDPGLASEKYIFPGPELLRTGHYFKLLTPEENASYTVRYQSAVGL